MWLESAGLSIKPQPEVDDVPIELDRKEVDMSDGISDDCLSKVFAYLECDELFKVGIVNQRFLRISKAKVFWIAIVKGGIHKYKIPKPIYWKNNKPAEVDCSRSHYARRKYHEYQMKKIREERRKRERRQMRIYNCLDNTKYIWLTLAMMLLLSGLIVLGVSVQKPLHSLILFSASIFFFAVFISCFAKVITSDGDAEETTTALVFTVIAVTTALFVSSILIIVKLSVEPSILWTYCFIPLMIVFPVLTVVQLRSAVVHVDDDEREVACVSCGMAASSACYGILMLLVGLRLDDILDSSWEVVLIPFYIISLLSVLLFIVSFVMYGYVGIFVIIFGGIGLVCSIIFPVLLVLNLKTMLAVPVSVLVLIFSLTALLCMGVLGLLLSLLNWEDD